MSDWRRVVEERKPEPLPPAPPSLKPWALLALVLVLIWLGIYMFWPIQGKGPVLDCTQAAEHASGCLHYQ